MPSIIFCTTEIVAYGMGSGGTAIWQMIGTPVTGVETAWGEGQRPTSPATSLTSEGVQEISVANNTRCASCPIAWPTRRPGSHDLPVTWLALSEFRYCRHNSCSVELCLDDPAQIQEKPATTGQWLFYRNVELWRGWE